MEGKAISKTETTEIVTRVEQAGSPFWEIEAFERVQRIAKMLSSSNIVPQNFRGNVANIVIALEMANRTGMPVLFVMNGMYIVHGKPSWSGQAVKALIEYSGKYRDIHYEEDGESCRLVAVNVATGRTVYGPIVTTDMAKNEGWSTKDGSKWKTMPGLMLRYRAATFFGRTECPGILCGMPSADEIEDYDAKRPEPVTQKTGAAAIIQHAIEVVETEPVEVVSVDDYIAEVDKCATVEEAEKWRNDNLEKVMELPGEQQNKIFNHVSDVIDMLGRG